MLVDESSLASIAIALRSSAVFLYMTAQGLRLLRLTSLSALVNMFLVMVRDLARWLVLVAVVIVAFSLALSAVPLPSGDACPDRVDVLLLFDVIVGGGAYVECLEGLEEVSAC
jgi:hypothetical protein